MKLLWTWIFLLCIGSAVHAQLLMGLLFVEKDKINNDVVKMGLQLGGNMSTLSHPDNGTLAPGQLLGFYRY